MLVLSHRGCWKSPVEMNSLAAFERSFQNCFGIELDVRDAVGRLVVSHDPAGRDALPFDSVLKSHQKLAPEVPLAVNIKADGLQPLLASALRQYQVRDYFVFDMSVPDTVGYAAAGLQFFTRHSEVETVPALYNDASGIWLDAFFTDWADEEVIAAHLLQGKRVCLVSPELHCRDHRPFWNRLQRMARVAQHDLMLCTDYPEAAKDFFHE